MLSGGGCHHSPVSSMRRNKKPYVLREGLAKWTELIEMEQCNRCLVCRPLHDRDGGSTIYAQCDHLLS